MVKERVAVPEREAAAVDAGQAGADAGGMAVDRAAARHALISIVARRQKPGSGSLLSKLMRSRRERMDWWTEALASLGTVRHAVAGAVAANTYMPPRQTADIDVAVRLLDLPAAEEALRQSGWMRQGTLRLGGGLRGSAWSRAGRELDLLGLPGAWGEEAITTAQRNVVADRPTLTLEHLVVAKLIAGRAVDVADLSRMLGAASMEALAIVREAVARHQPEAGDDLEQLIVLGKLEYEPPRPDRPQ